MRILMHSMACPDRDPEGALELAASLHLDGLELICQRDYRCAIAPDATLADARKLATVARSHGSSVQALTPYAKGLNAIAEDERRRAVKELDGVLGLAAELGATKVRIFAGAEVTDGEVPEALKRIAEAAQWLGDRALALGLDLCLENHMDTMALSAARTMAVLNAIGHPAYGVLYDQANLDFMKAEGFRDAYACQRAAIRHVHVKDFFWQGDERRAAVVGDGTVQWRGIIQALVDHHYDEFLSLEYERRWFPDQLPEPEIGIARSRDAVLAMLSEAEIAHSRSDGGGRVTKAQS